MKISMKLFFVKEIMEKMCFLDFISNMIFIFFVYCVFGKGILFFTKVEKDVCFNFLVGISNCEVWNYLCELLLLEEGKK